MIRIKGNLAYGERRALPAGSAVSWGAITAGTLLDGVPYPYPVFEVEYAQQGQQAGVGRAS